MEAKIAIVGAGLAGITAAIRLAELGYSSVVVDSSLPHAQGDIGGFAKFSGAKFSLPPAGMGLISITKSEEALWYAIRQVAVLHGLDFECFDKSVERSDVDPCLRQYDSLVLDPHEIDELIQRAMRMMVDRNITLIQGVCTGILENSDGMQLSVSVGDELIEINSDVIFYAGGRLGTDLLLRAGIEVTDKKGIDVGVRIEFLDCSGLSKLRQLGPDAKIIKGNCRTFCLNLPGNIYRYPFGELSIPGGIVASSETNKANVGVLCRSSLKKDLLKNIVDVGMSVGRRALEKGYESSDTAFGDAISIMRDLYGKEIVDELQVFSEYLRSQELISWNIPHIVHLPLIDWHWATFSQEGTFKTNKENIYCLGDSSGHARGLLQAAVSGWLAAEEYADEY